VINEVDKKFNRLTTLVELLDYAAVPDLIEERVVRLKEIAEVFPTFKTFLKMAHSQLNGLEYLTPYYQNKPVTKTANRQEIGFEEFFKRHLSHLLPSAGGTPDIRRSKFARIADFLEPRDFELIAPALQGQFAYNNPKINALALKLAFPNLFPNA